MLQHGICRKLLAADWVAAIGERLDDATGFFGRHGMKRAALRLVWLAFVHRTRVEAPNEKEISHRRRERA